MTMKFRAIGWVALSGLFAVSLVSARPKVVRRLRPDRSRRWCRLEETQGQQQVRLPSMSEPMPPAGRRPRTPAELQIVDSGWFAADNGMVDLP